MRFSRTTVQKHAALLALTSILAGCALKPQPLDSAQSSQFVADIRTALAADTDAVHQPLDLYAAMARAIRHNQELKVEEMNRLLGEAQNGLQSAEMLPRLVASAQAGRRSNINSEAGYSKGNLQRTGDLTFSWNILDLGVSYYRALQASDRALIAAEQYRKAAHQIMEETRAAFWRALALQRLDAALGAQAGGFSTALGNTTRLVESGLADPIEALGAQRELLLIQRDIDLQRRALVGAEEQLRALINYPPGVPLKLVDSGTPPIAAIGPVSVTEIADFALNNRPELKQAAYEMRITAQDAKIAFLELFPSVNLAAGAMLDQNPLLLHNGWTSVATQASWQLIRILQYPVRSAAIEAKSDVDRQKALAYAVAIIMQSEISLARLKQAQAEYRTQSQMSEVQRRLRGHTEHLASVGRVGQTNLTRERMNSVLAEARRLAAYGEVQGAYAGVIRSMGQETVDLSAGRALPLADLAAQLRAADAASLARQPAGPARTAAVAARTGAAHHE